MDDVVEIGSIDARIHGRIGDIVLESLRLDVTPRLLCQIVLEAIADSLEVGRMDDSPRRVGQEWIDGARDVRRILDRCREDFLVVTNLAQTSCAHL